MTYLNNIKIGYAKHIFLAEKHFSCILIQAYDLFNKAIPVLATIPFYTFVQLTSYTFPKLLGQNLTYADVKEKVIVLILSILID